MNDEDDDVIAAEHRRDEGDDALAEERAEREADWRERSF